MLGADCKRFLTKFSKGSSGALNKFNTKSNIFCGMHVAKFVIPQSSALTPGMVNNNTPIGIKVLPQ